MFLSYARSSLREGAPNSDTVDIWIASLVTCCVVIRHVVVGHISSNLIGFNGCESSKLNFQEVRPIDCSLRITYIREIAHDIAGRSLAVLEQQPQQASCRHDQHDDDAPQR